MNDPSYEAGYRAGHLQGWLDAMAKVERERANSTTSEGKSGAHTAVQAGPAQQGPVPAGQPIQSAPSVASDLPPAQPAASFQSFPQPVVAALLRPATQAQPAQAQPAQAQPAPRVAPSPMRPVPPRESPAQARARKEKRDRQNINIILYVASFLLVAAAALFIGTGLAPALRFAGVCVVTAAFYGAGMLLHARAPRLRPAAVAFAGTGLALVPFVGLAMYNFALPNGPVAWLLTSILGIVAYVAAAIRLNSRVLVYLSLTFLISTALSGVSVLGGALVWHFTALMGMAVLLTLLSLARPGWVPPLYLRPLRDLHPYLVPAVAVAATLTPQLGLAEHALVMGMATAYFTVMAVVASTQRRLSFYGARVAMLLGAVSLGWHLGGGLADGILWAGVALAAQAMFVAFYRQDLQRWMPSRVAGAKPGATASTEPGPAAVRWRVDAVATFGAQLLLTLAYGASVSVSALFADPVGSAVPAAAPVVMGLVTAMVLATLLRGRSEWLPVVSLVASLLLWTELDRWLVAGMFIAAVLYGGIRAFFAQGINRDWLVLGTRAVATAAVPIVVLAVEGVHREQASHALIALVLAVVCQQALGAVMALGGIRAGAPVESLAAFTCAGLLAFGALSIVDRSEGRLLTAVGGLVLLAATLVVSFLFHSLPPGHPAAVHKMPGGLAQPAEILPFLAAVITVPGLFLVVGQGQGNAALAMTLAYFLASAARSLAPGRRAAYWLLSRVAGSALAVSLFLQWDAANGPWTVDGARVGVAAVVVAVFAVHLVFPLLAAYRDRAPEWVPAEVGAALAVQLGAASWTVLTQPGQIQLLTVVGVTGLSSAAGGYALRATPVAAWFAPAVFLVLLGVLQGDLPGTELVLAVFAAYSVVMVVAAVERIAKGIYFVAARLLTAALAVVLSYDIAASAAVVTLTFAAVLAAQHVVRWMMRRRLSDVPFQQAAVWITLAGQALLPLAYLFQPFGNQDLVTDGGRWVLFVVLGLLAVSAVVARKLFNAVGALYFVAYAVLFAVLMLGPVAVRGPLRNLLGEGLLDSGGVAIVLMVLALAATAAGIARRNHNPLTGSERWLWAVSAGSFSVVAILVAWTAADPLDDALPGTSLLVLAVVLSAVAWIERLQWACPPAAALVLSGAYLVAGAAATSGDLAISPPWDEYFPWAAGIVPAAGVLYAARAVLRPWLADQPVARWSLAGAAFVGFGGAALAGLQDDRTAWVGALLVLLAAIVVSAETPPPVRRAVMELGALAVVASVQRAALLPLTGPGPWPDFFWLFQWYVALAAVLAALRFLSGQGTEGRLILGIGAGLLTMSGVLVIFGGTGAQQLWILIAMALLMVGGILVGERAFVWWGAAGVGLCILWAMREYTFALLALIAVVLIAFAVWRLNRSKPGN